MADLVIEVGDTTTDSSNITSTTMGVQIPAYADGDLVICFLHPVNLAAGTQTLTVPAGTNSETFTDVVNCARSGTGSGDTNIYIGWYIGNGSASATNANFTASPTCRWGGVMVVVPAGEFDAANPISTAVSTDSATTGSTLTVPAFSANSDDAGGKLLAFIAPDSDPISAAPTGYTDLQRFDPGRAPSALVGRDAAVTASESIASAAWTIASDAWVVYSVIVRTAAANHSAAPALQTLTFTGFAPTVQEAHNVGIGAPDDLLFTGFAPTLLTNHIVTPATVELRVYSRVGLYFEGYPPTVVVSGGGDTTITMGAPDALAFTGFAPTALVSLSAAPTLQTLTLTGFAPTVQEVHNVGTGAPDALTITGFAPTILVSKIAQPTLETLTLTGFAPTAQETHNVSAGAVDALAITGFAPAVLVSQTVAPTVGSLTLTGFAPTVQEIHNSLVPVGTLALTGFAPTALVSQVVFPTTVSLGLTGFAPTPQEAHNVSVPRGTLNLTGQTPLASILIDVPSGSLGITGFIPVAGVGDFKNITVSTGSLNFDGHGVTGGPINTSDDGMGSGWGVGLAFVGYPPTVVEAASSQTALPGVGSLALTGFAPTVQEVHNVSVPTGTLNLTGFAPTGNEAHNILTGTGSLNITGFAPLTGGSLTASPATGSLAFTGFAPSLFTEIVVQPTVGSLGITGQTPTLGVSASPDTGSLALTGFTPVLAYSWTVTPTTGSLSLTGYAPQPSVATASPTISVGLGSLTLTGYAPTINVGNSGVEITNLTATFTPSNYEQCDYSGFRVMPGSLKMTWNRYAVRQKSYESRHPQDLVRSVPPRKKHGPQRPEQDDDFIDDLITPDDL